MFTSIGNRWHGFGNSVTRVRELESKVKQQLIKWRNSYKGVDAARYLYLIIFLKFIKRFEREARFIPLNINGLFMIIVWFCLFPLSDVREHYFISLPIYRPSKMPAKLIKLTFDSSEIYIIFAVPRFRLDCHFWGSPRGIIDRTLRAVKKPRNSQARNF